MIFLIFEIILILFLIFLLIFIILDVSNSLFRKIYSVPSSSRATQAILKILEKRKKGIFVDLGCGMGKLLIAVKKKYPEMEVAGYENWPSQFFLAKLLIFLSGAKIKIFYKNLFLADLNQANIIYCYLSKNLIKKLEKKLEIELKGGTLVISSTFPFPNWKPNQVIVTNQKNPNFEKLFIYEK
jgi:SAM-dependent methyltransferase